MHTVSEGIAGSDDTTREALKCHSYLVCIRVLAVGGHETEQRVLRRLRDDTCIESRRHVGRKLLRNLMKSRGRCRSRHGERKFNSLRGVNVLRTSALPARRDLTDADHAGACRSILFFNGGVLKSIIHCVWERSEVIQKLLMATRLVYVLAVKAEKGWKSRVQARIRRTDAIAPSIDFDRGFFG